MMPLKRRQLLLKHIEEQGSLEIKRLVGMVNVSESTVRRDLRLLSQQRRVEMDSGMVMSAKSASGNVFHLRGEGVQQKEKQYIAARASELIKDGETIALDTGSTVLELARAISPEVCITCLTNSLVIAAELSANPNIETIHVGGTVNQMDHATMGPIAENVIRQFNVDKVFLGAAGISLEKGITNFNMNLIQVRKSMIDISKEVIVLADDSKFSRVGLSTVARLNQVHCLVSNKELAPEHQRMLTDSGIQVILAG